MYLSPVRFLPVLLTASALALLWPVPADSACCGLSAAGKEVQLPAQKVFIDWDPDKKTETLILQPGFEGDTADFCLLVPTPTKPVVAAAPPDFFAALATFTTLKRRTFPESKLKDPPRADARRTAPVMVLGEGVAGTLGFKIVAADNAAELNDWLKENGYLIGASRQELDHYVKQKWFFTLVKVSPAGIKKQGDGLFAGEVAPIRLTFATEEVVLPLRIARPGVRDQLDLLCYVQAPMKVDLAGPLSYQYQWVAMLRNSRGSYPKALFPDGMPGRGEDWLKALGPQADAVLRKGKELDFGFTDKQRPAPNKQGGRVATTLEWARRLNAEDIQVLKGAAPYTEVVPDPDEGFSVPDVKDPARADAVFKVIQKRLERYAKDRPAGYVVRQAPADSVKRLKVLDGTLKEGRFVTKFRKIFTREEMKDDPVIIPARAGQADDVSEYTELLPVSP